MIVLASLRSDYRPQSRAMPGRDRMECLAAIMWNRWPESMEYAGIV